MELGADAGGSTIPVVLCLYAPRHVVDMEMEDAPEEPQLLVGSGPDGIVGSGAVPPAIAAAEAGGPSSQAPGVQIAAVGSSFMLGAGQGAVPADGAAEAGSGRFVPIRDVKGMLQSGRLEGMQIVYRTKKDRKNLLYGVIKGLSYFCSCSDDCEHMGKVIAFAHDLPLHKELVSLVFPFSTSTGRALSARAFQQHALGSGNESYNPNDHIIICSSNISLFDACRRLKEATSEARLEAIFDTIKNVGPEVALRNKMAASAKDIFVEASFTDNSKNDESILQVLQNLQKRMESIEKCLEQIQAQLERINKKIDFICKEMVRYQGLFQELSKVLGKFVNES
ncbi:hypothetical protein ACP4OV_015032 [Aristida adscensionis]